MPSADWPALAAALHDALGTTAPPMAITFVADVPAAIPAFETPMPAPAADGRTGRVAAGCVFWMHGAERTFHTVAADHANCSVGSVTHGFQTLADVGANEDVATLLAAEWVTEAQFPELPVVQERPAAVIYGPLAETTVDPDVILLRVTGRQLMVLHDAFPSLRIEGKPQCHIIALAKEQDVLAVSVGCQLSRVRTGMPNAEMTCAIPARRLAAVVDRIRETAGIDNAVAAYASGDMRRFA